MVGLSCGRRHYLYPKLLCPGWERIPIRPLPPRAEAYSFAQ
jgi:hypothetical protein